MPDQSPRRIHRQNNPGGDTESRRIPIWRELLKEMQPPASTQQLSTVQSEATSTAQTRTTSAQATEPIPGRKETDHPAAVVSDSVNAAAGKTYILFEGTVLETVLINRLDGQFSGPSNAFSQPTFTPTTASIF